LKSRRKLLTFPSSILSASDTASARKSCSGSWFRFSKGSTASVRSTARTRSTGAIKRYHGHQRLDVPRTAGPIAQCIPQTVHSAIEAVLEIDENAFRPKPPDQLLSRDQLTGVLQQWNEHPEGFVLNLNPQAVFAQFPASGIGLVWAEAKHSTARLRRRIRKNHSAGRIRIKPPEIIYLQREIETRWKPASQLMISA